jgi:FeS assembly SUF system protein
MDFLKLFRRNKPDAPVAADPKPAERPLAEAQPPREERAPAAEPSATALNAEDVEQGVIEALRTVYDPEIPVNIYELGLVYDIDVDPAGKVVVRMTLTSPGCPVAGSLVPEIEGKTRTVPGVTDATVQLVWDPPWNPSMMSDAAKLQLGMF